MKGAIILHAIASAQSGDARKAHEIARIQARLTEAALNEPMLEGLGGGFWDLQCLHTIIWEICLAQVGTDEDFDRLESALAKIHISRATVYALRTEVAGVVSLLQAVKRDRMKGLGIFRVIGENSPPNALADSAVIYLPDGIYDAICASLTASAYQKMIKPLKDGDWRKAFSNTVEWCEREFDSGWLHEAIAKAKSDIDFSTSFDFMSDFLAPDPSLIQNSMLIQACVDQSIIACVLERYRITHGSYPDSLDSLTRSDGTSLPTDVVNGQSMKYQKTADGRYRLWGVGIDGIDNGGIRVVPSSDGVYARFADSPSDDWVWSLSIPPHK